MMQLHSALKQRKVYDDRENQEMTKLPVIIVPFLEG